MKEPFYGVRQKVVGALAKPKTQQSIKILIEMLRNEGDARPQWNILQGLGVRSDEVREAMLEFLKKDGLPYR